MQTDISRGFLRSLQANVEMETRLGDGWLLLNLFRFIIINQPIIRCCVIYTMTVSYCKPTHKRFPEDRVTTTTSSLKEYSADKYVCLDLS